ncbi:MAG: Lrp/AsnC family transcriptional regulator [Candidatus Thorarchaeota archaeon]|nr:Lrp/AsnC family transcriptional regulator [Candidatus Thorarchaeota archaeon]
MVHKITEREQVLLRVLVRNARTDISTMADLLGVGRNWVSKTIRNLVVAGVIRAYVAVFDPAQVYAERNTILLLKTNPRELMVSKSLLEISELESLDGVSGEHSLLGLFRFRSSSAFEDFLNTIDSIAARSGARTYDLVQVLATYKTRGFIPSRLQASYPPPTNTEWELMSILSRHVPTKDRPMPLTQKEIGLRMSHRPSQPAVSKAMSRLEERGTILGYSIDVDHRHLGLPVKFFLQIKSSPGMVADTAQRVSEMPEVWDLHRTSEALSLFATVRARSIDEYNQFLRKLYKIDGVEDTQSQVSLEEWPVAQKSCLM